MSKEEISEIIIVYDANKEDEEYEENEININIFGEKFVENKKYK